MGEYITKSVTYAARRKRKQLQTHKGQLSLPSLQIQQV